MRYLPLTDQDRADMLARIGAPDIDALFADIPAAKRLKAPLPLPETNSEIEVERTLARGGAAGKRLDFLAQELNREANTLASKAATQRIADCALELKLLIEQVREQVQNIE